MSDPVYGIGIQQVGEGAQPAVVSDMSTVGLVGTAPNANPEVFPLNTPIVVFSDNTASLTALGEEGTLYDAILGINAQLGDYQSSARCVIVRIEAGANIDETIANAVGSSVLKTGIHALPLSGPINGVIPRLIGVPGLTSQQYSGLATLTLGTRGEKMTEAPTVVFSGGGSASGKVLPTAHSVLGTGDDADKVVSLVIDTVGRDLSGVLTVSFTGGGSDADKVLPTATAAVEVLANPVVAALPAVLSKLVAHAVVDGPATTVQAFTNWRETINSQRIIPLETAVKASATAVKPGSSRILGIGVRRDHEYGGRPFHSWANQAVMGIVGPNRPIDFSLTDGAVEGQMILAQNGGVIVRGEMGVESAVASGGFVYVGTDTCAEDPLWTFYNVSRGRDYIHLLLLRTLRIFLGKRNIDVGTLEDVLNTVKFAMRDLEADKDILPGWQVGFRRDQNSPEQLRLGRFTIEFACEEPPVLRYIGIQSKRNRASLEILLDELMSSMDVAA